MKRQIFSSLPRVESNLIPEIKEFLSIIDKIKPEGLIWKYVEMPEENHMSILANSLTDGIKFLLFK